MGHKIPVCAPCNGVHRANLLIRERNQVMDATSRIPRPIEFRKAQHEPLFNMLASRVARTPSSIDILLRVNAEESRAVGVSGLQSNHRTTRPFGHGESHSVGVVDCWRCQTAVTPILDRVWRPSVVFATGTPEGVSRVGGIVVLAFSSRHRHTLRGYAFTDCRFGYCLVTWADRPPPKDGSESAPFRPIPALV